MSLSTDIGALAVSLINRTDSVTGYVTLSPADMTLLANAFADLTTRAAALEARPVPAHLRGALPVRVATPNVF